MRVLFLSTGWVNRIVTFQNKNTAHFLLDTMRHDCGHRLISRYAEPIRTLCPCTLQGCTALRGFQALIF